MSFNGAFQTLDSGLHFGGLLTSKPPLLHRTLAGLMGVRKLGAGVTLSPSLNLARFMGSRWDGWSISVLGICL